MCICVCVRAFEIKSVHEVRMHAHLHMHMCVHVCLHACVCMRVNACFYGDVCLCVYAHVHVHEHAHVCMCVHA